MPKPITLTIDIEEIAFGRVWRLLDTMPGVVNIKLHGEGPKSKPGGSKQPQKKGGSQSVPCLVLGALIEANAKIGRDPLNKVLEANGKKATSLPDAIQKLFKAKEIQRFGKGRDVTYGITVKGRKRYETACEIQQTKD
jgi:hypothetical protein